MPALFFDLDGCLVDSRAPISTSMNAALEDLGLPTLEPSHLHGYIGPPLLSSFESILTSLDADPARAVQAVGAYRHVYPEISVRETQAVAGVQGMLRDLEGRSTLMVVTSKPVEYAVPILDAVGLAGYFEAVLGPALDAMAEAKATKLEEGLTLAGVPASQRASSAVMIGDRRHDIEAGHACGTGTIGVTWGIGDRAELTAAGAHHIADDPREIAPLVMTTRA